MLDERLTSGHAAVSEGLSALGINLLEWMASEPDRRLDILRQKLRQVQGRRAKLHLAQQICGPTLGPRLISALT